MNSGTKKITKKIKSQSITSILVAFIFIFNVMFTPLAYTQELTPEEYKIELDTNGFNNFFVIGAVAPTTLVNYFETFTIEQLMEMSYININNSLRKIVCLKEFALWNHPDILGIVSKLEQ